MEGDMDESAELRGIRNIREPSPSAMEERHAARAEMCGLSAIINNVKTLHGIKAPPDPEDFDTQEAYAQAYNQWYLDTCCWKATRTDET
jgi:hypothetical protein